VAPPAPTPAPAATLAPATSSASTKGASKRALDVPRPVAAYLGDSYTTGWSGAGNGKRGWPAIVSASFGWKTVNLAVAGTGFVNPGWTGQRIRTRVTAALESRPGIVFVAGGHNDRQFGSRATGKAADAVLLRLRRELPDAVIVVIGPIWANGSPPAAIRGIRTELRRHAAAVGAIFVDPIREGWFAGSAERFILADGIHPSNAGHRRIATRVLAALDELRQARGSRAPQARQVPKNVPGAPGLNPGGPGGAGAEGVEPGVTSRPGPDAVAARFRERDVWG
jgi:acyl-CoA thioesterase-1